MVYVVGVDYLRMLRFYSERNIHHFLCPGSFVSRLKNLSLSANIQAKSVAECAGPLCLLL